MLKSTVKRKGKFTAIPLEMRKQVWKPTCQVCGMAYGRIAAVNGRIRNPKQVIDHLLPRRWLAEHGIYEHSAKNLLSVCDYCHAPKSKLEDRLYQGDLLSYLQGLKRLNYPVSKVVAFALSVGLKEFKGVKE